MTQDFFLGQLRLILIAVIAFAAGKGWLSTDTTTLLGAVLAPIGLLFGPWLWSIYHNINMKLVPKDSVAVGAENVINRGTASVGSMALITSSDNNPTTVAAKVVGILLVAVLLSAFLAGDARAQGSPLKLGPVGTKIKADIDGAGQQVKSAVTGQPAPTSSDPLPCTFQMLIKLTPGNLLSTINQCVAGKLVTDTQRALDSAKVFGGTGDGDAVNCLTPGLAIFKAGVQVPEVPAVLNDDGSVKTAAVPAQEPGPILLYQKYREFTLAGGLTACQTWFNGPINATIAAGIAGAGTAVAGAALLAPVK